MSRRDLGEDSEELLSVDPRQGDLLELLEGEDE